MTLRSSVLISSNPFSFQALTAISVFSAAEEAISLCSFPALPTVDCSAGGMFCSVCGACSMSEIEEEGVCASIVTAGCSKAFSVANDGVSTEIFADISGVGVKSAILTEELVKSAVDVISARLLDVFVKSAAAVKSDVIPVECGTNEEI